VVELDVVQQFCSHIRRCEVLFELPLVLLSWLKVVDVVQKGFDVLKLYIVGTHRKSL